MATFDKYEIAKRLIGYSVKSIDIVNGIVTVTFAYFFRKFVWTFPAKSEDVDYSFAVGQKVCSVEQTNDNETVLHLDDCNFIATGIATGDVKFVD